jgi:hypothetical protein
VQDAGNRSGPAAGVAGFAAPALLLFAVLAAITYLRLRRRRRL